VSVSVFVFVSVSVSVSKSVCVQVGQYWGVLVSFVDPATRFQSVVRCRCGLRLLVYVSCRLVVCYWYPPKPQ
jgi:hypothetical protein